MIRHQSRLKHQVESAAGRSKASGALARCSTRAPLQRISRHQPDRSRHTPLRAHRRHVQNYRRLRVSNPISRAWESLATDDEVDTRSRWSRAATGTALYMVGDLFAQVRPHCASKFLSSLLEVHRCRCNTSSGRPCAQGTRHRRPIGHDGGQTCICRASWPDRV